MAARDVPESGDADAAVCDRVASNGVGSGPCADMASVVFSEQEQAACRVEAISPDENNGDPAADVPAEMSKNQQKKLKKQAAFEAKKAAKKLEEKAAKRVHQEKKLAEVHKMIAGMTDEERQAWEEQMSQKRQVRWVSRHSLANKLATQRVLE